MPKLDRYVSLLGTLVSCQATAFWLFVILLLSFKPHYQLAFSPRWAPHISYATSLNNLCKHQDILFSVIILVTLVFDDVAMLLGKVRCSSFLRLKG